jgi:hypothetical protein
MAASASGPNLVARDERRAPWRAGDRSVGLQLMPGSASFGHQAIFAIVNEPGHAG